MLKLPLSDPLDATRAFHLFHDEAGFANGARYGLHGMLAVPDDLVVPLGMDLSSVRRKHGYWNEIHYKDLGGTKVEGSAAWRVANEWLQSFFSHYAHKVRFKAFGIDSHHEDFDKVRYPSMTAAYRRFIISNAKALVAWCLRGSGTLLLTPYTDAGNPSASKVRKDGDLFRGFDRYVQRECERARRSGKLFYPEVRFVQPLKPIVSSPSKLTQAQADDLGISMERLKLLSDWIQLVDLLTGSLCASLTLEVRSEGKRRLAEMAAEFLASRYDVRWEKSLDLRRRFSFSCFPGPGRTPYAVSLKSIRKHGIAKVQMDPRLKTSLQLPMGFHLDAALDEPMMRDERQAS